MDNVSQIFFEFELGWCDGRGGLHAAAVARRATVARARISATAQHRRRRRTLPRTSSTHAKNVDTLLKRYEIETK